MPVEENTKHNGCTCKWGGVEAGYFHFIEDKRDPLAQNISVCMYVSVCTPLEGGGREGTEGGRGRRN